MSLLQQVINNLSSAEARRATLWLEADLHNRREDCRILFRLRRDSELVPTPEAEYAAVYPDIPDFDAAKHRQLEHQLLKRLEAFLAWDTFHRDGHAPDAYLMKAYRERGLDDHRRTRLKRYRPSHIEGTDRLLLEYHFAVDQYDLDLSASRGGKVDYLTPEYKLEKYIIALRLRQACMTIAHQRLHQTNDSYKIPRFGHILEAATRKPYRDDPFIQLFHLVTRLQLDEPTKAETAFTQVTERLVEFHHRLPTDDRRNLMLMAINYGLRRANTGSEPAIKSTFVLYKLGLELGLLHDHGRLSIFAFNNILGLAIRLKEVEWAASFLDKHQRQLPEKGGNEVLALGRARLALANGQDGDALYYLQQADFKDFIHHLTARVMQLKVYFRQDSYTLLHSHIGSTRKLLTRRKRVGYHLQNYRNIFQLANAIIRLAPGDEKAKEQLRDRIQATDPCTERPWLLSVLD